MTPTILNVLLLMAGPLPDIAEATPQLTSPTPPASEARPAIAVPPPVEPVTSPPGPDAAKPIVIPDVDPAPVRGQGEETAFPAAVSRDPVSTPAEQDGGAEAAVPEEIVVSARRRSSGDPVEAVNVQSYKAVQALDGAVVAPLAKGYKKAVPKPVRRGIHNFLDNLQEPIVFLNYILQLKPGKAAETLGRFALNTTVGLAGVVDVAKKKPFNLPHRANSLANTLGYYGVGPGPYLFLPLIGPTTLRDLLGTVGDRLVLPTAVGAPFDKAAFTIPANVLSALDYRVTFDESLTKLKNAPDPYAATRANYLARRKAEIDGLHSPKWRARHSSSMSCAQGTAAPSTCPSVLPASGREQVDASVATEQLITPDDSTPLIAGTFPASAPVRPVEDQSRVRP